MNQVYYKSYSHLNRKIELFSEYEPGNSINEKNNTHINGDQLIENIKNLNHLICKYDVNTILEYIDQISKAVLNCTNNGFLEDIFNNSMITENILHILKETCDYKKREFNVISKAEFNSHMISLINIIHKISFLTENLNDANHIVNLLDVFSNNFSDFSLLTQLKAIVSIKNILISCEIEVLNQLLNQHSIFSYLISIYQNLKISKNSFNNDLFTSTIFCFEIFLYREIIQRNHIESFLQMIFSVPKSKPLQFSVICDTLRLHPDFLNNYPNLSIFSNAIRNIFHVKSIISTPALNLSLELMKLYSFEKFVQPLKPNFYDIFSNNNDENMLLQFNLIEFLNKFIDSYKYEAISYIFRENIFQYLLYNFHRFVFNVKQEMLFLFKRISENANQNEIIHLINVDFFSILIEYTENDMSYIIDMALDLFFIIFHHSFTYGNNVIFTQEIIKSPTIFNELEELSFTNNKAQLLLNQIKKNIEK
ncbi:hypothetical protein TRFO_08610 [Tritrichomonas foetus]|uniref:Uncharacterized protein n=1 Tax=Tritrichomonas foetus TaxID=1144522 RepID=A0A1J4JIT7_9EUKA|nr:hypothetical protein TRFO_08610 [Tritrichomonas foetus]|eukprot:OHS99050.1 hypothetical protein TRFO_08610 [Tritrichomonas foetus]